MITKCVLSSHNGAGAVFTLFLNKGMGFLSGEAFNAKPVCLCALEHRRGKKAALIGD